MVKRAVKLAAVKQFIFSTKILDKRNSKGQSQKDDRYCFCYKSIHCCNKIKNIFGFLRFERDQGQ